MIATYFSKGIRRRILDLQSLILKRVSRNTLIKDMAALGLSRDDFVCVHSAMHGLGYVIGGAQTLIEALRDIIGPQGHLMMPTFSNGLHGNTINFVKTSPVFDPQRSPSTTGQLSEVFRCMPGVLRSAHPTHSVAVQGPRASDIVANHHLSSTPFGNGTPYDHLLSNDGKVLLLNVNANSLLHRIEEMVEWPNNYLPETFTLPVRYRESQILVESRVHSDGPTHHLLLKARPPLRYRMMAIPSYALPDIYMDRNRPILNGLQEHVRQAIISRNRQLYRKGIVTKRQVAYGFGVLIDARRFAGMMRTELEKHLAEARSLYRLDFLQEIRKEIRIIGDTAAARRPKADQLSPKAALKW